MPSITLAVVVTEIVTCDGSTPHEARVITDGRHVCAFDPRTLTGHTSAYRDGTAVVVMCEGPGYRDQPCHGRYTVPLVGWKHDPDAAALLSNYGTVVDR